MKIMFIFKVRSRISLIIIIELKLKKNNITE